MEELTASGQKRIHEYQQYQDYQKLSRFSHEVLMKRFKKATGVSVESSANGTNNMLEEVFGGSGGTVYQNILCSNEHEKVFEVMSSNSTGANNGPGPVNNPKYSTKYNLNGVNVADLIGSIFDQWSTIDDPNEVEIIEPPQKTPPEIIDLVDDDEDDDAISIPLDDMSKGNDNLEQKMVELNNSKERVTIDLANEDSTDGDLLSASTHENGACASALRGTGLSASTNENSVCASALRETGPSASTHENSACASALSGTGPDWLNLNFPDNSDILKGEDDGIADLLSYAKTDSSEETETNMTSMHTFEFPLTLDTEMDEIFASFIGKDGSVDGSDDEVQIIETPKPRIKIPELIDLVDESEDEIDRLIVSDS